MIAPRKYDPQKRRAAYERTKARALAAGYPSVKARATALRPQALNSRQRAARQRPYVPAIVGRTAILAKWGVTLSQFNRYRRENLAHTPEGIRKDGQPGSALARAIQTYRFDVGEDSRNWSDARVGYVITYHEAVVNPKTNFFSADSVLYRNREVDVFYDPEHPPAVPRSVYGWTEKQFLYLVRYGGLESVEDFDRGYGDSGSLSQYILRNLATG